MDILQRYELMKQTAKERGIKLHDGEVATLVLADILEDVVHEMGEAVKSLDQLS